MEMGLGTVRILGLGVIMLMVLILPFAFHKVEEQLELFLLAMGVSAVTVSGLWSGHLIHEALKEPINITAAVLIFGLLFRSLRDRIRGGVAGLSRALGAPLFLFLMVSLLGLLSSLITAIVASLVLAEIVSGLRFDRTRERKIVILSCYSIGLGAVLTPLGEPLSTIAVVRLAGEPYHADFFFLLRNLGAWIIPGVLLIGAAASFLGNGEVDISQSLTEDKPEHVPSILLRTVKVCAFVAALVFLGNGFSSLVDQYLIRLPKEALYWVNMISAVLDNATLTAAEISPKMSLDSIRFLLMGLLIAGGMLIPGNIPNIISAGRLGIKSRDWASFAVPIGLGMMLAYFLLLEVFA